jgi:hypothetical protein
MIENSTDARPQSGLTGAEMVFEAVAEGGITRFLAVYQCQSSIKEIGPVRSARTYYVDWAKGLDALYAHVGGSPDGLAEIESLNVADLNQFSLGTYFWRSSNRVAPHNVYTTIEKLYEAALSKSLKTTGKFDALKHKEKESTATSSTTKLTSLAVGFSSTNYNVLWNYDSVDNVWFRTHAGVKQLDTNNQKQISAKNIAVAFTGISTRSDGRKDIVTTGTGDALVYIDGKEVKATWKKKTTSAMLKFYDENGKEIQFNPGNLWIEFVQEKGQVVTK